MEESHPKSVAQMSDLESAIVFSLQCHKRADNQHGYWFDLLSGESFGSELWRLKREAFSDSTLAKAEITVKEALSWLARSKDFSVKVQRTAERMVVSVLVENKEFSHDL